MTLPPTQPTQPRRSFPGWLIIVLIVGGLLGVSACAIIGVGAYFFVNSSEDTIAGIPTIDAEDPFPTAEPVAEADPTPDASVEEDLTSEPIIEEDPIPTEENVSTENGDTKTVVATDGQSQINVPRVWQERADLNDEAEIQAANPLREQYVIVLTESKADFEGFDVDLPAYAEIIRDNFVDSVGEISVTNEQTLSINGNDAIQYELRGTVDDLDVVYWMTGIESDENYYQVLSWTLTEYAARNEPVLQDVVQSFQPLQTEGSAPVEESTPVEDSDPVEENGDTKTIVSTDGQSQVDVPLLWEEQTDLNDEAELQVASPLFEQYMIVLTESKSDFEGFDINLQSYAEIVRDNFLDSVGEVSVTDEQTLSINGNDAIQYELRGVVDDLDVVYWMTCVEGNDNYYQILSWTLLEYVDISQPELQQVVESFQET
ncbi:MAG: hypothetical protein GFH27_549283n300 [Chloroflexi bacterium AL-W]|nr:hypothetical protein [Chloroflexi bacterium AL-N1]NOK64578.1 hypothetical protein [Chloroflexi bacterium AL-N10]NOK75820.1 hypothetical protein [Chloroflexi bacterium AL-N5]NOK80421.1 hypothetical protein [Chloroflexi bacterium AL-W]NOK86935.1 hypothetical protein [Chloroflexi bacterium AL-N15]